MNLVQIWKFNITWLLHRNHFFFSHMIIGAHRRCPVQQLHLLVLFFKHEHKVISAKEIARKYFCWFRETD